MATTQKGVPFCDTKQGKPPQDDTEEKVKESLGKIKHKFIVMSGKGGVGKTSTSVNL